jgi:hypothetical protein
VLAYKLWRGRKRKQAFWGLSPENMRTMEREYEVQFETYRQKTGASARLMSDGGNEDI